MLVGALRYEQVELLDIEQDRVIHQEMLLKNARGKLPLPGSHIGELIEAQGFPLLSITSQHVETTRRFERALPDPFDRLLVATAAAEGMNLLTQDTVILSLANDVPLPIVEAR